MTLCRGEDKIIGFDIDIAQAIADELGVELEVVDMDFDGLIPALLTGKVDMTIAGMNPTEEENKASISRTSTTLKRMP